MKKLTEKQATRTRNALQALRAFPFRCESCDPKHDAQRNLQGRTHYVDDDTLRGFQCRILNSGIVPHSDALLYFLVESVASRPDHGGYNKRAVLFDTFGTVLTERDDWHRTSDQAQRAMVKFLESFDLAGHYRETIRAKVRRMREDASCASRAMAGK